MCIATRILLIIGGLNLGLTGLGTLISKDLNIINMLLGGNPTVEAVLYLIIGIAALKSLIFLFMKCSGKSCCK